jgi:hypothetical protein
MDDAGFEHDAVHTNHSGAIIALETKVGTGSSTAVADSVLAGTGSGTSSWSTAPSLAGLTVDTSTLHVDATNNRVGVGTASPTAELEVRGASNPEIRIVSSDGTDPALYFGDSVDLVRGGFVFDTSTNDLQFRGYNNSTVMTIESDGQVGIGTTSPSALLHVNAGTVNNCATFESTDAGAIVSLVDNSTTGSAYVGIRADGDNLRLRSGNSNQVTIQSNGDVGIGTLSPSAKLDVNGSLSKNSGSFKIPHPLPAMAETHNLVHSFVEAPQADNLYRGRVVLVDGAATVDLDEAAGMTTGTFELLNRDLQCFIVNNEGWTAVRGSVSGSTLTITAQDAACADMVDWLVVGERHDQHMYDTEWTDDDGRVIVEPVRPAESEALEPEAA